MFLQIIALVLLLAADLPGPASIQVAGGVLPGGILVTDGRGAGLALTVLEGKTTILSEQPGAGRNIVVSGCDVLFKECPPDSLQRVIFSTPSGHRRVLYEAGSFSGPFPAREGTFLVADNGYLLELDTDGSEVSSFFIAEDPAWAALTDDKAWLTGAPGGILVLQLDGSGADHRIPGLETTTFSRLFAGPGGGVLAVRAAGGFIILDENTEEILIDESHGLFPRWTPDGRVLYSILSEFEGPVPVSGRLESLDPALGVRAEIPSDGVPLHPLELPSGDVVFTDAMRGMIHTVHHSLLPEIESPGWRDEPEAHFDVPYMHQRWDTPDWFNGSWSCGPTSCMMTVQFYRMLPPDSIWASYPSPGHWSPWGSYIPEEYTFLGYSYNIQGVSPDSIWVPGAHGFICRQYGGAVWDYMVDFLEQHEVSSAWAGQLWSTLTAELDVGYPVVCSSNVLGSGQIILFNGYYADHTVIVNDPYGNANEPGWGSHYNGKDVLYDWPGYNNGHVEIGVSQLFYAQASIPQEADTLVDDRSMGFEKLGSSQFWHLTGSGWGGDAWWTWSTAALPDTCIGRWTPVLPGTGNYNVFVYIPPDHAAATGIYRLETISGVEEILLNQGDYSNEWAFLGTFSLDDETRLILGDYTGTGSEQIAFDAALFSPSGTGLEQGTSPPPDGGCLRGWPNPCTGSVSFTFPSHSGERTITIWDISGRLAASEHVPPGETGYLFSTENLPSGVYIARMSGPGMTAVGIMLTVVD